SSHYGAGADAFVKSLEADLPGKFQVEQFPNSALGGERAVLEGLQLGTIDLAIVSTGATVNFVPATGVFDIPFLFRDLQHARNVLDGESGQKMLAEFAKRGLVALARRDQGVRQPPRRLRRLAPPAGATGREARTMENPLGIAAVLELGVLAAPRAGPDVAAALRQGTIDGQESPMSVIVSAKLPQL